MTDITVEVLEPNALTAADQQAWRALQSATPAFANPLFGPDFFLLVGQVRSDARVAVYRRAGEAVGFLPFHRRRFGFARPIGAPFSDYQALVAKGDFPFIGQDALTLAGVKAFRANGLIDPHGVFADEETTPGEAHAIVLDETPDAYLEAVRAASPKKFKNYRRLEHRLEREVGPLRLVANDRDPAAFTQLLAWKQDQFRRTGLQDVLKPDWVQAFMRALFETSHGLMITLYAGDTLVAGHFGVRSPTVFHPWIASANPELNAYSPGQLFLGHAVRAMPGLGLDIYDLGPGSDHYKRPYANLTHAPRTGLLTSAGVSGAVAGAGEAAYRTAGLHRIGPVDKVARRLDHILAVDPTLPGVLRGLAEAASGLSKRSLGNETLSPSVG